MINNIDFEACTILIIDDTATNLRVVADYLEEYDFDIIAARDGEEGLEKAEYAQPDLILLDVMMPGIDGFETCRRLKSNKATQEIPVIFMTALNNEDNKVKGFEVGAVDYVTKPIQQREVLARVSTHLKIKNLTQKLRLQNTRLEDLSNQLQQANAELTKVNANKDTFFSILAHDLRSPFHPLLTLSEMLPMMIGKREPEVLIEMSEAVHNSAQNIYRLLENLLQWSSMQRGKIINQPISLNLKQLVNQNIALLENNATNKNIRIQNKVSDNIIIYIDEKMLNTILRNLISNALKFTPKEGKVIISARPHPTKQFVEIAISDTGVGIAPNNLKKLFKIEAHHSTVGTDQEQGTGLGLIICKEMVAVNGGQIWIESEQGKGTTITFTAPCDESIVGMTITSSDEEIDNSNDSEDNITQTLSQLIPPPHEELLILFDLASMGDVHQIYERADHIEQLDSKFKPFADKLRELAKAFNDEQIVTLVKEFM